MIGVKVTQGEKTAFQDLCRANGSTPSAVIRAYILRLLAKDQEKQY